LRKFTDTASQFKRLLEDSKLIKLTRLKADDLQSQLKKTGLIERYCFLSDRDDQFEYKDIQFGDELKIGNQHLATYTLGDASDLPSACGCRINYDQFSTDKTSFPVSFAAGIGLLLPCDHLYNQYILIGDTQTTLKQMEKKRLRLQSLSAYSRANAIARAATNDFLNEAISQQGRLPVKAHFNVMTWSEDRAELEELKNGSAYGAVSGRAVNWKRPVRRRSGGRVSRVMRRIFRSTTPSIPFWNRPAAF
jgi:hypothetical protein